MVNGIGTSFAVRRIFKERMVCRVSAKCRHQYTRRQVHVYSSICPDQRALGVFAGRLVGVAVVSEASGKT